MAQSIALEIAADTEAAAPPVILTRYLDEIEAALRRAAPSLRSRLGRMTAYHMGWIDADGRPCALPSGKRVRPSLALWACEALGAPVQAGLPAAVAVELIHNFTLVHDDIQDGDVQRHHRPTVWSIWGSSQGINAGDGIFAVAMSALLSHGPRAERRLAAARALSGAVAEVVEGQCLDIALEGAPPTSADTYLRLATAKTGALLGAALASGALLAGGDAACAQRFDAAGRLLGLAFQVRDDWLGTWGDPQLTGKAADGDLRRRKVTYPIVAAYDVATPAQRRELRRLFRDRDPSGTEELRALLVELGGAGLTDRTPRALAHQAVDVLDRQDVPPPALREFAEVAAHVAERDH